MSEKGNIGDGNSINPDPDPESIILNELRNRVKTNNQPIKRNLCCPDADFNTMA